MNLNNTTRYDYVTGNYTLYYLDETSLETASNTYGIIGSNNFEPCDDTAVVHLGCGGTGFIIGKNLIATAAHCVLNGNNNNLPVENNTVTIKAENGIELFSCEPVSYHVPTGYFTDSHGYDYAIIELASNIDLSQYGYFRFGTTLDSFMTSNADVTVSGFPYYEEGDGEPHEGYVEGNRYKAIGKILNMPTHSHFDSKIFYTADNLGGTSGGPVYITETLIDGTECKTVIGINTNGGTNDNSGVRITTALLKFFNNNPYT